MVNYRGSSGYGSDSMECLLGKCGTQDVRGVPIRSGISVVHEQLMSSLALM